MAYDPDPGGRFASDAHRRLLAVVPSPDEDAQPLEFIVARLDLDPHVALGTTQEDEIKSVLGELGEEGYITEHKDGKLKTTKQGWEQLNLAPPEAEEEAA